MRFVPAAVTPVRMADMGNALLASSGGLSNLEGALAGYFSRSPLGSNIAAFLRKADAENA